MTTRTAFNIETSCRPNILALEPYRCARDDYKDDGTNVLLDANENAFGPGLSLDSSGQLSPGSRGHSGHVQEALKSNGSSDDIPSIPTASLDLHGLNRYPDPHQEHLKSLLCKLRQDEEHTKPGAPKLSPENLFVGVGSDEAIDNIIRCFCTPSNDRILICPPTYGMYTVSAHINDAGVVKVPQIPRRPKPGQDPKEAEDFSLDVDGISKTLTEDAQAFDRDPRNGRIKLVFLCTPGNPTSSLLSKNKVESILQHPTFNGIVVLDEAYIDFAPAHASLASLVTGYPNLMVMQTLSKAFGLAGIRCGAAFTSKQVAKVMNSMKAPYNLSEITSQLAIQALQPPNLEVMAGYKERILEQRKRLIQQLPTIPGIGRFRGGFDANFVLVEILDRPDGAPSNPTALKVYNTLAQDRSVVVRFRGKEHGCEGCLRVTVGTESEVDRCLDAMRGTLQSIHNGVANGDDGATNGMMDQKPTEESVDVA